jgi:peptidoglycan hydrolase CwlO-like protein
MSRKSAWASLVVAVALSLIFASCRDTKTMQENQQLKTQVADLQKQVGEMGNNLDTVTADRDNLKKENEALKAQLNAQRPKRSKKKVSARKRRRAMMFIEHAQPAGAREIWMDIWNGRQQS